MAQFGKFNLDPAHCCCQYDVRLTVFSIVARKIEVKKPDLKICTAVGTPAMTPSFAPAKADATTFVPSQAPTVISSAPNSIPVPAPSPRPTSANTGSPSVLVLATSYPSLCDNYGKGKKKKGKKGKMAKGTTYLDIYNDIFMTSSDDEYSNADCRTKKSKKGKKKGKKSTGKAGHYYYKARTDAPAMVPFSMVAPPPSLVLGPKQPSGSAGLPTVFNSTTTKAPTVPTGNITDGPSGRPVISIATTVSSSPTAAVMPTVAGTNKTAAGNITDDDQQNSTTTSPQASSAPKSDLVAYTALASGAGVLSIALAAVVAYHYWWEQQQQRLQRGTQKVPAVISESPSNSTTDCVSVVTEEAAGGHYVREKCTLDRSS
jgi:hypothetical protein